MEMNYRNLILPMVIYFLSFQCWAQKVYPSMEMPLKVIDAPQWDEIFKRTSGAGWYSGDGVFSIPFNGLDFPGNKSETKTFWLFSDSHFCTGIDESTYLVEGDKMVNHSIAVMNSVPDGSTPNFNDMHYYWGENGDFTRSNIFGERMWAMDGLKLNDTISMFMLAKTNDEVTGVNMVKIPVKDGVLDLTNYTKQITPFIQIYEGGHTRLGSAVMDNTIEGGAHTPDGYVYVYGARKVNTARGALVGRVLKENFTNLSAYEFWNGSAWTKDVSVLNTDQAEIFTKVSSDRYSVTPIHTGPYAGKYMAIYMTKLQQPLVEYKISDTPVGPWSDGVPVWGVIDELDEFGLKYTNVYGAKAHPHLSNPGELLISYCVNIKQGKGEKDHNKNRARFFRLILNEFATNSPTYIVSQTYNKAYASGYASSATNPERAFSLNNQDVNKWQDDTPGDKWISIDLKNEYYINRWQIAHEGYLSGDSHLNTRDFVLQKSDDNLNWTDVDEVVGNTLDVTSQTITETKARYWRVYIIAPSQDGTDVANILNINLYGKSNPTDIESSIFTKHVKPQELVAYPTLVKNLIYIAEPKGVNTIKVWSIDGSLYHEENTADTSVNLSKLASGIYIISVNNQITKIRKQ